MVKRACGATLTVMGLLALPSAAGAATSATVSIRALEGNGFDGYVKSSKRSCESGRKVILYKQKRSTRDRSSDTKIGTDIAQPNGPDSQWSVYTNRTGKFYAYATKTSSCYAAYSKTVRAVPAA